MMPEDLEMMKTGIEAVTSSALKPVTDLIGSIFGPAAEEAGLMLKDHVRVFRAERQLRLYQRTAGIFAETGVKPQHVPLKLLFPIIENASVEETDELQDRWANLLAHAADPATAHTVNLTFPTILRELSPRQAKFLDAIYDSAVQKADKTRSKRIEYVGFDYSHLWVIFEDASLARRRTGRYTSAADLERDDVKADREEVGMALDVFIRHRILEEVYEIPPRHGGHPDDWEPEIDSSYQFTNLGVQFVTACRRPRPRSSSIVEPEK